MLCKDCEHFKIVYEPIKGIDGGLAKCEKYNLLVNFLNKRKFNWLSCQDRPIEAEEWVFDDERRTDENSTM